MTAQTCTVCHAKNPNNVIWAYAQRKGTEIAYPVCHKCASHEKPSCFVVDQLNRKLDRQAGYR